MSPLLRDRQAWLFSAKTFAASIAALYVALAGNLSRPYWAMATVYIVSQRLLGPTRAKGVYRVLGTLLAGVATLVMLPNLVETPLLLSAAMALWLSACLFLALLNRGPRGYAFLLAGYTTAFIGFPAVTSPEGIFDTVVARSEEIILGTVMAVLFASLLFPASVKPMVTARIGNWMQDAAQWCRQVLQRGPSQAPRNRLAADLVQFEALIAFVRHDDPRHAGAAPALEQLRARMLMLLPVLSSIADRLDALRRGDAAPGSEVATLLEDVAAWVDHVAGTGSADADAARQAEALRARIEAVRPVVDQDIDRLLLDSLLLRLKELLDLWQDCRALQQALVQGTAPGALRTLSAAAPAASMPTDAAARDATAHSATPGALLQRLGFSRRRAAQQALPARDDAAPHAGALPSSTPGASTQPSGQPSAEIADTPVAAHATRHIDFGMAAFSALSAGFALMAYCVLWIGIGWEGGGNGAMMAAVTAAFFAAQDDPAPSMLSFLTWAVVASVVAGIYQFGIFPAIHDFSMLVLVLAAVFLPLGALLHRPRSMLIALPLVVNLTALLSLQNTYSANLQSFVNAAVAMVLGIGFAVVLTRLFRSVGAEWSARRLVRQGWRTLADAADGHGAQDRQHFAARMLDLLGLLAPRLALTPEGSDLASVDMLNEVRVGLNILQLRRARHGLPASSRDAVDAILRDVAAYYRQQVARKRPLPGPDSLRDRLDASLTRVGKVPAGAHRDEALLGLVGLRYSMFAKTTAQHQDGAEQPPALAPLPPGR
ncbi:FUSC family protein [Xanthomonas phaseoli]|uniref:Multidrug transporter n=1 Tax=Xanthomonas phaseoli pv. dieffenbachiae TaxID=92828 RepID=A0A1V9HHJ1_9XANT|nr:FUSC family protein [Xanthomonas phaseoli]MBO9789626.1 FUSC family protein [Xanthomonas phaseoli pv. dieffenbachiae]MBO9887795.1 FUSC family protein [Xanthomonas phaseoli pv. dieffenbachiae]MBO9912926.1 FUSC family protein [Xanthomonas phaseoli pv. dieffenbachiae]MBO9940326.1 FUSC family protein [Xanthomonas phaseoli pv. dieffenbachiae]MBO9994766.1 FUSC family protein [Xanthomonas phaseoli pv. dieffenbachiae]